jgi:hypothetical protein
MLVEIFWAQRRQDASVLFREGMKPEAEEAFLVRKVPNLLGVRSAKPPKPSLRNFGCKPRQRLVHIVSVLGGDLGWASVLVSPEPRTGTC